MGGGGEGGQGGGYLENAFSFNVHVNPSYREH